MRQATVVWNTDYILTFVRSILNHINWVTFSVYIFSTCFHIPNKPSLILSTLSIGCKWFKNFISKYFGCGFHFETTSLASESSSMIVKCCELSYAFHLCLCQILGHVLHDFFDIPNKPSLILSTLSIGCKWFKNFISKYFGCGFHVETTSLASESSSMIVKCCEFMWRFIAISLTKSLIKI